MKVEYYITPDGKKPITKWFDRLRDAKPKTAIIGRIDRLQLGLFGDAKSVGSGVFELRIDVGAGIAFITLDRAKRSFCFYAAATKRRRRRTL